MSYTLHNFVNGEIIEAEPINEMDRQIQINERDISGKADIVTDTTAHWNQMTTYIPPVGTIVVYSDRNVIDGVNYAGVKLGDGLAYLIDLPFLGDDEALQIVSMINTHAGNTNIHVTSEEKEFWNNKLNCVVIGEKLYMNRN